MIYYFSGTGNSFAIAKNIADKTNDKLYEMVGNDIVKEEIKANENIGFIFPVYAWGLPKIVDIFLSSLPPLENTYYIYAVFTCGDEIGLTDKLFKQKLQEKGWQVSDVFSVVMRETYICLPGFDIDKEYVEHRKFQTAIEKSNRIAEYINKRHDSLNDNFKEVNTLDNSNIKLDRGSLPYFKSYVLRSLFNNFLTDDKYFHVNIQVCTRCGKCVKNCPLKNIRIKNEVPTWNGHCTLCLRCYHACPCHAIEYGIFTKGKGQVKINF